MRRSGWLMALGIALACVGCQSTPRVEPLVARLFLEARAGEPATVAQLPVSKVQLAVGPNPVLTESDLADVEVIKVPLGWCLAFHCKEAAARDLYRMSVVARGRRLLLTLNGLPLGISRLEQPVTDGTVYAFLEVEDENLPPLADRIRRTSAALHK